VATESFGPSALVTPANAVTIIRLLVTPVLLFVVVHNGPSYGSLAFWVLLSCTDGLDGWLARRHGTTRSGAFLDPLADKCLVVGAMVALVADHQFWWVPVTIIAVREFGVSLYRTSVGRRGISVPARTLAKVKTIVQDVAVGFALLPTAGTRHPGMATGWLWAAVGLTAWTAGQYLLDGRKAASASGALDAL
jgi:CDP-diacylglycerol--glycerol-3-phosphate 3-phosphatidyltransferase